MLLGSSINMNIDFWTKVSMNFMLDYLTHYKEQKEKEGFIPTIEMLIEDLEESKRKQDENNT